MIKKISSWFLLIGLVFALTGCGAGGSNSNDGSADTAPTVASSIPAASATDVALDSSVTATFSEDVDQPTVHTGTFTVIVSPPEAIFDGIMTYNGHTYAITESTMTWDDARLFAEQYGGHLVTINDAAENQLLISNYSFNTFGSYWLGYNDQALEGTFVWANAEAGTYTNWNAGEPNNWSGNENCAQMWDATGVWNDQECIAYPAYAVIEWEPVAGQVSYSNRTATFTPSATLSASTVYTATITTGVKDAAGNAMTADYTWSFTTAASVGSTPLAPSGLTVTSATKTQISLSWTASAGATSYTVERAPEGSTTFGNVATGVTTTAYTDTTINQYTAYTYKVKAVNGSGTSNPSNEDKAGPPPTGFNVAVEISTSYAFWGFNQVSMVLDENDDPMMTYVQSDLNRNGNNDDDSYLYFVKWDRTNYNWTAPLAVDMVGQINNNQPHRQVSIVRDASTGTIGIAYQAEYDYTIVNQLNDNKGIKLALSTDGGSTWSTERVDQISGECSAWGNADPDYCDNNSPSLVMSGGDIHIAYTAYRGLIAGDIYHYYLVRYATRAGTSGAFSETNAPWITGTEGRDLPVGLALDGNGQAGLAYMVISTSDTYPYYNNSSVVFWRPGDASATKITDSSNAQNDFPSISLAFDGTKPRIAYHLMRDLDGDNEGSDEPYYLYFSASDDGVTWGSPVGMPFDGGHKTGLYQSIDTGSQGQTAIAAMLYSSSGSNTCGSPKLYSSSDNVNWTVCGADADDSKDADSYYISLNFAGNDKLYLAFGQYTDASSYGGFKSGLILWREP